MNFLRGLSVFFSVKICLIIVVLITFGIFLVIIPKKIKKNLAIKIINHAKETHFLTCISIFFLISTVIAIYASVAFMQNLKINMANQYALCYTLIDGLRFLLQIYKNKLFISFSTLKEHLYNYIQK